MFEAGIEQWAHFGVSEPGITNTTTKQLIFGSRLRLIKSFNYILFLPIGNCEYWEIN